MSDVTRILHSIEDGDPQATEQLFQLIYEELRNLAAAKMAQEKPGQTLQATALIHESFLRLVGPGQEQTWKNRRHFFAAAAETMRRILVDNARRKLRSKHGGDRKRIEFEQVQVASCDSPDELLQIDEVLDRLSEEDETAAEIAKSCYFAGLTVEQSADLLGISRATAYRHWTYAKAWLHAEIKRAD